MVQGKKQLNSKPKFADVVNTFRLYNRNKPSAEIAGACMFIKRILFHTGHLVMVIFGQN